MASLELNHIYKVYQGGVKAVNDMTMKINDKEFIVFVGPSGCGKSTTLRMIAGLEEISAGELKIGDQIVNDMPPKERNIAMVFQNYALYPHMTVYNNIAYGLRISHTPKDVIDKKVHEAAKILGIEEYLDRKPKALSGGQRQRVALGRAIVRNPKVFLLDEPLSNLDAKLRGDMRAEISKLHQRLATTFIYVTHDQTEAMTMGTRIVVMKNGFVQQIDTPRNVYNYPANKFVAGFIGTPQMNFFDGTMLKKDDKVNFTLDNGLVIPVPYKLIDRIPVSYMDGVHRITLGVRPDNIVLHEKWMDADEFAYLAKVSAHFDIVEVLGGETILYGNLKTDNPSATSEQTAVRVKTTKDVDIHSNEDAELAIDLRKIHVFDAETEKTLIEKIPSFSTLPINVAKDKATIVKEKFALAPALVSQLEEGAAEMRIPSDAVILGAGEINATVVSSEIVGEKKLFALNVDGHLVFAVSSPSISLEGKIKIDFDQTKLSFKGHKEVKALNVTDILKGNLYKSKEYKTYLYKIEGKDVPVSQEQCQKLFSAKGKVILKTPLEFSTSAYDLDLTKNDFEGTVTTVYDYGKGRKFGLVKINEENIIVHLENPQMGDRVCFGLDPKKTLVLDASINIILA